MKIPPHNAMFTTRAVERALRADPMARIAARVVASTPPLRNLKPDAAMIARASRFDVAANARRLAAQRKGVIGRCRF